MGGMARQSCEPTCLRPNDREVAHEDATARSLPTRPRTYWRDPECQHNITRTAIAGIRAATSSGRSSTKCFAQVRYFIRSVM